MSKNNPVAKHMHKVNKSQVYLDRKKEEKKNPSTHDHSDWLPEDEEDEEEDDI